MSLLDNISISLADLKSKKPDIEDYYFSGQSDFDTEITEARKHLYRMIKKNEKVFKPHLSDENLQTRLNNVKDYDDTTNLKDILVYLTISKIMETNRMYEEAKFYNGKANSIELDYYIDEDSSGTAEDDEQRENQSDVLFSR